jgi:hypothetical protein
MTPDHLRYAGEALYGTDWYRALARALGPLHPRGARETLSDRLIHFWAAGDRPIPGWVPGALQEIAAGVLVSEMHRLERVRKIADGEALSG